MKIQTYKLWLEADGHIPALKRLRYALVEIPFEDVFLRGIHPSSVLRQDGMRDCTQMADIIIARLNEPTAFSANLKAHNLGHEVAETRYGMDQTDPVEWQLKCLGQNLYFVEELTYEQLLNMAITRLRASWDRHIARDMLSNVGRDFAGMRDMLKRKDPDFTVTSYAELDTVDVSRYFGVDDFLSEEQLLLSKGLETLNFRTAASLKAFTDEEGRLRVQPQIDKCQVQCGWDQVGKMPILIYHCRMEGRRVRWNPTVLDNHRQKAKAREIARLWGKSSGRYCFTTDLADIPQMLDALKMKLSFPDLRYIDKTTNESDATGQIKQKAIICFRASFHVNAGSSNETIKDMLRRYDRKMTGRKEDLVQRMAELLAEQYAMKCPEMDQFFRERRFIRLTTHEPTQYDKMPVLDGCPLAGHLLAMYCFRHMRGNVVLDAQHENNAVTLPDLAEAILFGRVKLTGCFVPVQP